MIKKKKIRDLYKSNLHDYWLSIFNVFCKLCPRPTPLEPPKTQQSTNDRISASTKSGKVMSLWKDVAKPSERSFEERNFLSSSLPRTLIKDFGKSKYGLSKSSWILLVLSRLCVDEIVLTLLGMKVDPYQKVDGIIEESKVDDVQESFLSRNNHFVSEDKSAGLTTPRRIKAQDFSEDEENSSTFRNIKQSDSPRLLPDRLKLPNESELSFGRRIDKDFDSVTKIRNSGALFEKASPREFNPPQRRNMTIDTTIDSPSR